MKGHRIHALAGLAVAAAVFVLASTGVAGGAADGSAGIGALFNVGMGARALGMGGAFVAVADDGCAIYYNPAGLAFIDGNHVTSLYSDLFGAGAYVGLGYARPNLGASVVGLMSSVEGSDEFGNPTEVFSYREGAVAAGGAYAWQSRLRLHRRLRCDGERAGGVAVQGRRRSAKRGGIGGVPQRARGSVPAELCGGSVSQARGWVRCGG